MTLWEFYIELEHHDWFYAWSDDGRVYRNGEANRVRLRDIARTSMAHARLYVSFRRHHFSGAAFGKKQFPKPARPV